MNKNELLIVLSESKRTDFGRVEFANQADEQKTFSAIWELESEVNNGGFEQYFCYSSGETATLSQLRSRELALTSARRLY